MLKERIFSAFGRILPGILKRPLNQIIGKYHEMIEESRLKESYSRFVKENSLVFDIGANRGDHAKILADLGARVIAIEPTPSLVTILKKRFSNNPKVSIEPIGLASTKGKLKFNIAEHSTHSTFADIKSPGLNNKIWKGNIEVKVTTIENMIKKHGLPSMIKIDTEGFEYEVIKGLNQPVKSIIFEFNKNMLEVTKKCLKYLDNLGKARYNISLNINHKTELKDWVDSKNLLLYMKDIPKNVLFGDIYVRFEDN
jgi:FkbM family methyltransferase